jgi:hypothetical protein
MTLCQDVAHELAKMQTLNAYERDQIYRAEHDGVSLLELSRRTPNFTKRTSSHLASPSCAGPLIKAGCCKGCSRAGLALTRAGVAPDIYI